MSKPLSRERDAVRRRPTRNPSRTTAPTRQVCRPPRRSTRPTNYGEKEEAAKSRAALGHFSVNDGFRQGLADQLAVKHPELEIADIERAADALDPPPAALPQDSDDDTDGLEATS